MSLFMRKLLAGSVIATGAMYGTSAMAGEAYDWTGFYVGGLVGGTQTKSDSSISYDQYNDPSGSSFDTNSGWDNNNGFLGDVYNDIMDSSYNVYESGVSSGYEPIDLDGETPSAWISSDSLKEMDVTGVALLGGQVQTGPLVFGAELRGSFGKFSVSSESDTDTTAYASGYETCDGGVNNYDCSVSTDLPGGWSGGDYVGGSDNVWDGEGVDWSASYTQSSHMTFDSSYNSVFAPVGRFGIAQDRVMLFAMGGPTIAKVKATTDATVTETGTINLENNVGDDTSINTEVTYDWSGENTDTLYGYTVGGGMEWAVTDHVSLRMEGTYTNLGSINVTGHSDDTDATYSVKQDLTSYTVNTGFVVKF